MVTTPFRSMLFRKMLRDVLHQKTQFISVLLMAFLALFIYAGVGAEWHGLQRSADDFYAQTNLADVMIYGENFSEEQAARVRALPSVRAVEPRLEAAGTAALDGAPKMQLSFFGTGAISGFYLCAGSAFDREDTDGIWLSERFAGAHHLELGDSIEIQMGPLSLSKTIRGLVHSPEQVFQTASETLSADFEANGFAYLASGAFPMPESFDWNTLLIDADISDAADLAVTDTGRLSALEDEISEVLDGRYTTFLAQKDHPSVSMFRNEIAQHKMMGDIFPVVFVLIALLTMMTTMTRVVNNQRIQIGTLKAMGFKRGAIMRHYVSYGLVLPLLGAALGLVLGPLTLPQLFYPAMSSFYTLPEWKPALDSSFLLVALAVVAFCALITYRAAAKVLGDTPADTLRPKAPKTRARNLSENGRSAKCFSHRSKAPKTRARNSAERGRFWNKLRFHTQWNIRDTFRNPIRSCMAVVGVLGCTALVVCAFGMNDGMEDLKTWQYEKIDHYETKISLSPEASAEQIETIKNDASGELIQEREIEIRAGDRKKSASLLVMDEVTLRTHTDTRLNTVRLPVDGVSITEKMAKLLGAKSGDAIEWHLYGKAGWIRSEITAIYREPTSQGLAMSRTHFESLGQEFQPTAILSAERIDSVPPGADALLLPSDQAAGWDDLTESLYIMIYLMIAAAGVLSVVVLYNLGSLSFVEKERDFATLKVMGLKTGGLRRLIMTQTLWFTAAGFVLGIPAGMRLTRMIVNFSGDSFDFPVILHPANVAISFAFTFGLSVLVTLLFSGRLRKLNMPEALKALE